MRRVNSLCKIGVGLFGANGHQIHSKLENHPRARVVAIAKFAEDKMPEYLRCSSVRVYQTLDELLADDDVQLVSLCSPLRSEQAGDAVRCLEAGKHVYAEKPCAMSERELDMIISAAGESGRFFHEMGGTAFARPYAAMRKIVASGKIGEVIQVYGQKSYPWGDWRPRDENIDGGLALQVGVYNCRFVEHVAGVRIKSIEMRETKLGNEFAESECRRAVSFLMELENGGLASGIANYCCPMAPVWKNWGYETVRIFGTNGFVESIDNGGIVRLALSGEGLVEPDISENRDFFEMVLDELIAGEKIIPMSLAEELSPTRWALRAKSSQP